MSDPSDRSSRRDWSFAAPPDAQAFNRLAKRAFENLPASFRAAAGDVVLHTRDFADDETLRALGVGNPYELTGLYEGVDITRQAITDPSPEPAHVHLYRAPILAEWKERGDVSLEHLIAHVLVHEIGHHMGLSDDDMHRIEADDA